MTDSTAGQNGQYAVPYYASLYLAPTKKQAATWLDYTHPYWDANWFRWVYARDVYTGEVLDPGKLGSYLIRKGTGETQAAYFERQALADFTNHFGVCVDAMAGMIFHVEDDATRLFGSLGDANDPGSVAGALYRNADGKGNGYLTVWKQLAIELVLTHCHWVLVDVTNGTPQVKTIAPERVTDWGDDADGLAWVKVMECVDTRTAWDQEATRAEQYVVFDRTGWQRYRKGGTTDTPTVEPVGPPGTYVYEDASGKRQLPIFRVELPLRRNIGFPMAKKNVAIFNKESERDHLLRAANFPKLIIPAIDEIFSTIAAAVQRGDFALQDDPGSAKTIHFDAPPTSSADLATRVLEQKAIQFYKSFFRQYEDAVAGTEKTATEIRQDTNSGIGAFLQMLRAALDDAENQCLWRLEQAVYPNDRAKWNQAKTERSDNFQPLNADEEIERLRVRYFGQTGTVPLGRTAALEVLKQIAAWDGLPVDETEMQEALDNQELSASAPTLGPILPLPPSAKAKLVVRWLQRLGVLEGAEAEAIAAEAEQMAVDDIKRKDLLAQPLGPPPTPEITSKSQPVQPA